MASFLRILRPLQVGVATLWPAVLWAAPAAFGDQFATIPLVAWIVVCLLSTLAGATALLIRVSAAVEASTPFKSPVLLAFAHMAGSWLAGTLAFLLLAHSGMPDFLVGAGVAALSFAGAKACERIADSYLNKLPGMEK